MGIPFLARVRDRRTRSDRRATVGALGESGGARGAGEEVVARPEEDGPRGPRRCAPFVCGHHAHFQEGVFFAPFFLPPRADIGTALQIH